MTIPVLMMRTTFSKFIIEEGRRHPSVDGELTALLNDVQTACKFIASAVSRGALVGERPDALANDIMLRECEWGGQLCGVASKASPAPYAIPETYPRGRYLLVFDALDGSADLDVNVTVGTLFAIFLAPDGIDDPALEHFLQPGSRQVAAGMALYGPASTLVATLGTGVHGFTLDREIGAYTLTHPDMRIPESTSDVALGVSSERAWETPMRHYLDETSAGQSGVRGTDFNRRWIASLAGEIYRILLRGGVFLGPKDSEEGGPSGAHLLFEASPLAMLVEQAGGIASTGRERILDIVPDGLDARVPLVLGSRNEVERIAGYHAAYDRGESLSFENPLFKSRSLFRSPA